MHHAKREKLIHGKLSATPTRQSPFTVFNFSLKAGANLLNGPLTKRGDGNDCFLILRKGEKKESSGQQPGRGGTVQIPPLAMLMLG